MYTVYRTQNLVNGKYYFGVHKTENPYDEYLGSGKVLKAEIRKYGDQSFLKNVCFIFDNPKEAFVKEFELIETYRKDPLCYNLRQGGSGGFDWINLKALNKTPEFLQHLNDIRFLGIEKAHISLRSTWADGRKREAICNKIRQGQKSVGFSYRTFSGKFHTPEAKQKIGERNKIAQLGKSNSQFGTCWIVHDGVNKKIHRSELDEYTHKGWKQGRV